MHASNACNAPSFQPLLKNEQHRSRSRDADTAARYGLPRITIDDPVPRDACENTCIDSTKLKRGASDRALVMLSPVCGPRIRSVYLAIASHDVLHDSPSKFARQVRNFRS